MSKEPGFQRENRASEGLMKLRRLATGRGRYGAIHAMAMAAGAGVLLAFAPAALGQAILKVTPTATASTVAGTGVAGWHRDRSGLMAP